ncbi:hypothetical protein BXZ70DRAFT_88447 [Cristinia sonorae]|uniref:UV radiation resistance-associated gene protein n=1 Tax=Cristinia sonorae TaxID=1940300 RepID=A0A8K0XQR0_9AGAR|nr:hypothetical protein BXZ70DRAFT_88447 [Cristinia sonorae]
MTSGTNIPCGCGGSGGGGMLVCTFGGASLEDIDGLRTGVGRGLGGIGGTDGGRMVVVKSQVIFGLTRVTALARVTSFFVPPSSPPPSPSNFTISGSSLPSHGAECRLDESCQPIPASLSNSCCGCPTQTYSASVQDMPSTRLSSEEPTAPRRVRHLTAIQICNLSPSPVRDTLAHALAQPSEQPQFTSNGRLSDDLDITLGRKRTRKISSASVATTRSIRWENERARGESSTKKSVSSPSHSPVISDSSSARRRNVTASSTSTRPYIRPRAQSSASFTSSLYELSLDNGQPNSAFIPTLLRDTSQAGLERVFQSRLIETYVAVSIPNSQSSRLPSRAPSPDASSEDGTPQQPPLPLRTAAGSRRHAATKSMFVLPTAQPLRSKSKSSQEGMTPTHSKSMSISSPSFGRQSQSPPLSSASRIERSTTSAPLNYRSAVHRPSTNPSFSVDIRNEFGHMDDVDLSGGQLHIEIWGNVPLRRDGVAGHDHKPSGDTPSARKGKQKDTSDIEVQAKEWRILEQWDVDLDTLVTLSEESQLRQLPFNTLVISLSPPGRRYYLPPTASHSKFHNSISRPASPSAGYNSEPESDLQKVKDVETKDGETWRHTNDAHWHPLNKSDTTPQSAPSLARQTGKRMTPNWQDLLKLTTLQTVILDTKRSLSDVLQVIDQLVLEHPTRTLNREASERRACVREVEAEKGLVLDECHNCTSQTMSLCWTRESSNSVLPSSVRNQIDAKREALRIRRRVLREAEQAVRDEQRQHATDDTIMAAERSALTALRSQAPPLRSSALATLASIYPIELVSPPDLLFSIVDVPLPIPLSTNDPAPPTSLPAFREVNEDTVATALGFAAHTVQLLAAYMNKSLTYPITYIGSRSLIKDGISAMVGPRMFPLFSKGVDTYRFEYGVFLLNKNIELLMLERDLRALDMRHTLPNLKNLLLTLTDPESTPNKRPRLDISSQSEAGLHSPASSMLSEQDVAERSETVQSDSNVDPTTPTAGSVTPTNGTMNGGTKKSRTFLDLGPLTGFLRSRYPSSGRSTNSSEADGPPANGDAVARESSPSREAEVDDEDDRRTIRGAAEDKEEAPLNGEEDAGAVTANVVAAKDSLEKVKSGTVAIPSGQVSV